MANIRGKKKKLAEYVIDEIKDMLRKGIYKEGDKLPTQSEFAEQLGVSRLSLREALATLTSMGVIEQRPRLGTVILSGNPSLWLETMKAPFLEDRKAILELHEARKMLEFPMIKHSLTLLDQPMINKLDEIFVDMSAATEREDMNGFRKAEVLFSMKILEASSNRFLVYTFLNAYNLLEQLLEELAKYYPPFMQESCLIYKSLLLSLKENNPAEAYRYYRKQFALQDQILQKYYGENH